MNRKIKEVIMKKIIILALLFISTTPLFADQNQNMASSCDTKYDVSNPPQVTFLGDSPGDFVDHGWYGVFGWESYLSFQNSSHDYRN